MVHLHIIIRLIIFANELMLIKYVQEFFIAPEQSFSLYQT